MVGFVALVQVLPHEGPAGVVPIDGIGAGLQGTGMLGRMHGPIQGSTDGWTALPILRLVAGAVAFGRFCVQQRLAANPLILPSLLANKGFWGMLHDSRTDWAMLLGSLFLLRKGGGKWSVDEQLQARPTHD